MTKTDQDLMRQGWELFTRMFMKYDVVQKSPVDLGTGDRFNGAQVHMLEAIGQGRGRTVTELSGYFMVTKGAVSQIVSRLTAMGYVAKTKRAGNDKEIILKLTGKGRLAFRRHAAGNEATVAELMQLRKKYSRAEIAAFLNILSDVDRMLLGAVAEQKGK